MQVCSRSRVCLGINGLVILLLNLGYVVNILPEWTESSDVGIEILDVETTTTTTLAPIAVKRFKNRFVTTVSLVHIPKTGGTSLYRQFKSNGFKFEYESPGEDEKCFHDLNRKGGKFVVSLFRKPLRHVYSLYLECKYDDWGKRVTNRTAFPRDPAENITQGYVPAFERWLDYFADRNESDELEFSLQGSSLHSSNESESNQSGAPKIRSFDDFRCYDPDNLQVRFMTCRDLWPHGGHHHPVGFRENATEAVANMRSLAFVGIAEHFAASVCMLRFQLYLPLLNCRCLSRALRQHYETHKVPAHDAETLSDRVKSKVAKLSVGDEVLYQAAKVEFLRRVAYVEAQLGHRILCDESGGLGPVGEAPKRSFDFGWPFR
ncbi:unnamed protein product [Effrenium voratum]|nr:unnamed protein product [Effrenium voratum]